MALHNKIVKTNEWCGNILSWPCLCNKNALSPTNICHFDHILSSFIKMVIQNILLTGFMLFYDAMTPKRIALA